MTQQSLGPANFGRANAEVRLGMDLNRIASDRLSNGGEGYSSFGRVSQIPEVFGPKQWLRRIKYPTPS